MKVTLLRTIGNGQPLRFVAWEVETRGKLFSNNLS